MQHHAIESSFTVLSSDYALLTAIEGRALRKEGNEPVPWSGLQTELLKRMPGKKCERRAKHQRRIEAVRLYAFTPPGSSLD